MRVAIHPHARFLFQPLQIRRLILFIVSHSSFTWLTIGVYYIIYIIYTNSWNYIVFSRPPPSVINELWIKKPPCTSLQRVEKFSLTSKTSWNLYKISLSYRFNPCITAGILMILTISIIAFTNFHGYKNRIIREERS